MTETKDENVNVVPKDKTEDMPLRKKILERAHQKGIDTKLISLPDLMTLSEDDQGRRYVEDLNGVVRYYLGSGEVCPTEEYIEDVSVVDQNQHSATEVEGLTRRRN